MNDSESQFHYADRSVQSPSSIIALCSVAGNYVVCFFAWKCGWAQKMGEVRKIG